MACTLALAPSAQAEVIQKDGIRLSFGGAFVPKRLPRRGKAPIAVSLDAKIAGTEGAPAPQLRRLQIAINRNGRLDPGGLPVCRFRQIQPTTTSDALAACGPALVGEGRFSAQVDINGQSPYPSQGKLLAFNGVAGCAPGEQPQSSSPSNDLDLSGRGWPSRARTQKVRQGSLPSSLGIPATGRLWPSSSRTQGGRGGERAPARDPNPGDRGQRDAKCHSRPAILAHVYGTQPVPTSYTLVFLITHHAGTFGTLLTASLPEATGSSGYVTGLSLSLGGTVPADQAAEGYLSAGCPAPKGFPGAVFPLARATFGFPGTSLVSTVTRSCTAAG